jgi:hypothetical protein
MQGEKSSTPRKTTKHHHARAPDEQLERKLAALRKYKGAVRFFENHRTLLSTGDRPATAKSTLAHAKLRVRQLEKTVAALRLQVRTHSTRAFAASPPRQAICNVFGDYCHEAIAVAWCESHLSTTAQNGQYLGLFQMGSYERRLFGHGDTAHEQAVAAHRYFVLSGRDWSPWSCRWAA